MKIPIRICLAICSLALVSPAVLQPYVPQASSWKGTREYRNGLTVVSNPESPLYKGEILRLEEDLTIGAMGGKTSGLISPWYITVDAEGKIYVMDQGDDCVKIYSKTGDFLRSIGRRGQGPGELENPDDIFVLENFDLVFEDYIKGLNYFGKDGSFRRFVPASWMINVCILPDGRAVIRVNAQKDRVNGKEIRYCDVDLKTIKTLLFIPSVPSDPDVFRPFAPPFNWAVTTGERLALAYKPEYEIEVFGLRDSTRMTIKKAGNRVRISPEELAEAKKRLKGRTLDAPAVHPAVQDLLADDEGRLIAGTFEKSKDKSSVFYDVFDQDGLYLAKIPIPAKIRPFVWKKGMMYGLEEDAEGNPLVKRYRVVWDLPR